MENASQEPRGNFHPQQNYEGNESTQSINRIPTLSPHFIFTSIANIAIDTTYNNKLAQVQILYFYQKYKYNEKETLKEDALLAYQHSRYKQLELIYFQLYNI